MMQVINIEMVAELGCIVYLKTDPTQSPRMITAVMLNISGSLRYELSICMQASWHFAQEFSCEPDKLKAIENLSGPANA